MAGTGIPEHILSQYVNLYHNIRLGPLREHIDRVGIPLYVKSEDPTAPSC